MVASAIGLGRVAGEPGDGPALGTEQLDPHRAGRRVDVHPERCALQPERFELSPPYPNPFNPSTSLSFSLPVSDEVALKVYDASGRLVETLIDRSMGAGVHTVTWNAAPLPSGVYFFRLNAGNRIEVQRGVFAK